MSGKPFLRLKRVTKRFGPITANDAISLDLHPGEVVALLGENGAGKTTLMNILFGHYVADEGTVEVDGQALPPGDPSAALRSGIGMVHQHFALAGSLSVIENVMLGTEPWSRFTSDRRSARKRLQELGERFGLMIDPEAKVDSLSIGERQRVEILKALYGKTKVLILDEPTAVLTPSESEALFSTLRQLVDAGLAVIFISHKLREVMAVSDRILVLRGGRLAGGLEKRHATIDQLTALMVGEKVNEPVVKPHEPGELRLELTRVSTSNGLRNLSLELHAGTITGLAGVSGNGQAALADLLSGLAQPSKGELKIHGQSVRHWSPQKALQAGIGRIPEDRHAIGSIADMSITENVISESYRLRRLSKNGIMNWPAARALSQSLIEAYDVKCPSADTPIRLLSGGNMQKLILGRALSGEPLVILANQPARGLDIGAVAYVHERLLEARARGAAILLISEDLDEVLRLSDRIQVIFRGRLSEAVPRDQAGVQEIGKMMAGEGFEVASDAA